MALKTYEEMIGRAVTDDDFRARLIAAPRKTLEADGYQVSDEVLKKLEALDATAAEEAAKHLSEKFGDVKSAW